MTLSSNFIGRSILQTAGFLWRSTGIWERMETVLVFDEPIRTLNLEDTLIALCIHAAKHRWTSLKWTFDIATDRYPQVGRSLTGMFAWTLCGGRLHSHSFVQDAVG